MINYKKTLATALACGVFLCLGADSFASENTENSSNSLFNILINSQSDKATNEARENEPIDFKESPEYQEEFKARYDLYKVLKEVYNPETDLSQYISLLNTKAAKKEDLEEASIKLSARSYRNPESLNLKDEDLKRDVEDYLLKGKLFFDEIIDKTDINSLHAYYEASINSYAYKKANKEKKAAYDKIFKEIYDLIIEDDKKISAGTFTDGDKQKIKTYYENLQKVNDNQASKTTLKETSVVRNTPYLSNSNQMNLNENNYQDSPFYKNDKTKEAYKALPNDSFREKLKSLDTNNDGIISNDELKADGEYNINNLENWLKPFTVSLTGSSTPVETGEQKEALPAGGVTTSTLPSDQPTSTSSNPISGVPETVTISSGNNAEKDSKNPKKDTEKSTYASNQVKTGIEGISFVGIILVVAIVAYVILTKINKKDK